MQGTLNWITAWYGIIYPSLVHIPIYILSAAAYIRILTQVNVNNTQHNEKEKDRKIKYKGISQ